MRNYARSLRHGMAAWRKKPACALIQSSPKKTPRQIPPPGRTHIPFYLLPNQNFTFTPAYSERPMPGTAMPQGMLLMPMVVPWPV